VRCQHIPRLNYTSALFNCHRSEVTNDTISSYRRVVR